MNSKETLHPFLCYFVKKKKVIEPQINEIYPQSRYFEKERIIPGRNKKRIIPETIQKKRKNEKYKMIIPEGC